jgi:hypothetical protein
VELSALTGEVARALETAARGRAARIEQLAGDYAAGRYQPDPLAVSRAMLQETRVDGGQ